MVLTAILSLSLPLLVSVTPFSFASLSLSLALFLSVHLFLCVQSLWARSSPEPLFFVSLSLCLLLCPISPLSLCFCLLMFFILSQFLFVSPLSILYLSLSFLLCLRFSFACDWLLSLSVFLSLFPLFSVPECFFSLSLLYPRFWFSLPEFLCHWFHALYCVSQYRCCSVSLFYLNFFLSPFLFVSALFCYWFSPSLSFYLSLSPCSRAFYGKYKFRDGGGRIVALVERFLEKFLRRRWRRKGQAAMALITSLDSI